MSSLGGAYVEIGTDISGLKSGLAESLKIANHSLFKLQSNADSYGKKIGSSIKKGFSGFAAAAAQTSTISASMQSVQTAMSQVEFTGKETFTSLASNIEKYGLKVGVVSTAFDALKNAAVNNMAAIIGATTNAINKLIDLYNNSLKVRVGVEGIKLGFTAIWETAKLVFNNLKDGFSTIGKIASAIWKGEITSIGDIIKNGFQNIKTNVVNTSTAIGSQAAEGMKNAMTNQLSHLKAEDLQGFVDRFLIVGKETGKNAGTAVVEGVQEVVSKMPKIALGDVLFDTNAMLAGAKKIKGFFGEITEKLRVVGEQGNVFGSQFDATTEKVNILKAAITDLIESGLSASHPQVQMLNDQLQGLQGNISNIAEGFNGMMADALSQFGENIADSVLKATSVGEALSSSFAGIFDVVANMMIRLGKSAIASGQVIEAMKKALGTFNGLAGIAAGVGLIAFAKVVKASVAGFASPPKLAKGGLAYGETLAVVGDNRNASVDPEVIAPLSKLKSIIGDTGGGGVLRAEIRGDVLQLVLDRSRNASSVITGR